MIGAIGVVVVAVAVEDNNDKAEVTLLDRFNGCSGVACCRPLVAIKSVTKGPSKWLEPHSIGSSALADLGFCWCCCVVADE